MKSNYQLQNQKIQESFSKTQKDYFHDNNYQKQQNTYLTNYQNQTFQQQENMTKIQKDYIRDGYDSQNNNRYQTNYQYQVDPMYKLNQGQIDQYQKERDMISQFQTQFINQSYEQINDFYKSVYAYSNKPVQQKFEEIQKKYPYHTKGIDVKDHFTSMAEFNNRVVREQHEKYLSIKKN